MTNSDLIAKFDDLILSNYFDLLSEPEMGLFAPVVNEFSRIAHGYGSKLLTSYSEPNTITLQIYATRSNWRKFKDDLSVMAADKNLHKLWFSHEPDRFYWVKLDGESRLNRKLEQANEAEGTLTFIVPDGLAHAVQPKTFTNEFKPTFISQPNQYREGDTWKVEEGHTVTIVSDYKNKTAGSVVENPNTYSRTASKDLLAPEDTGWVENEQERIDKIKALDGVVDSLSVNSNGFFRAEKFTYNVLETAKRTFNGVFDESSESEQMAKLKSIVSKLSPAVYGFGSAPTGNMLNFKVWLNTAWGGSLANNSAQVREIRYNQTAPGGISAYLGNDGILNTVAYAEASDGTTPSSTSVDHANLETTFNNPNVGKLLVATKDSDTFNMADWEPYEPENVITIDNQGTYKAPAKYIVDFKEATNFLAFVSDTGIIQLGTVDDPENPTIPPSNVLFIDEMGASSRHLWSTNSARLRWSPDTSYNAGEVVFRSDDVYAANYGRPNGNAWHGPSIVRILTDNTIENWEATFRVGFKFTKGDWKLQQGMLEGNVLDKDNNFIAGFEFKRPSKKDENVVYYFFIGDTMVFKGTVPYKYRDYFGEVTIEQVGNRFKFNISGINPANWRNQWNYSKTFRNDDVANLRPSSMSVWFGVWGEEKPMYQRCSYTKFTKINTSHFDDVPLTFSKGDHLEISDNLKVFLNGTPAGDWMANASDKIYYDPGKTSLKIESDTNPEVKAVLEEVYL